MIQSLLAMATASMVGAGHPVASNVLDSYELRIVNDNAPCSAAQLLRTVLPELLNSHFVSCGRTEGLGAVETSGNFEVVIVAHVTSVQSLHELLQTGDCQNQTFIAMATFRLRDKREFDLSEFKANLSLSFLMKQCQYLPKLFCLNVEFPDSVRLYSILAFR